MAQAILESASGKSTLARQSNNHFGIKCGKNWDGGEVYRHDDDYKNGLLVRSCFRAYDDPSDSFMAHSDFLKNNRRYNFLFALDIYDYKSWARGLRKASYATDPSYAKKLIDLIEKHELYLLDMGLSPVDEPHELAVAEKKEKPLSKQKVSNDSEGRVIIKAVPTKERSRTFAAKEGYYRFREGDKMKDIAAHYNLSLKELYFMNRIPYGAIPRPGSQISVKNYIHFKVVPSTLTPSETTDTEDYLFEETITISSL